MDPKLENFMRSLLKNGFYKHQPYSGHREDPRYEFSYETNGTSILIRIRDADTQRSHQSSRVNILDLISTKPKKGFGSQLLKLVCDLADAHQITLFLRAQPFGPTKIGDLERITLSKLIAWYRKFGFTTDEAYYAKLETIDWSDGCQMIRCPRVENIID